MKTSDEIDQDKLIELFSVKTTPKTSTTPRSGRSNKDDIYILNVNKARIIEILLSKFKTLTQNFKEIVENLKYEELDKIQYSAMCQCILTDEEILLFKNYKGDLTNLSKVDTFLLSIIDIKRLKDKLSTIGYLITLKSNEHELIYQNIITKKEACIQLKTSEKFSKILEIILMIGNTMNQGKKQGNAKGFKLDLLNTLSNTKSSDNSMNLLDYIAMIILEKHQSVKDFYEQLPKVEMASKIKIEDLQISINEFQRIPKHLQSQIEVENDENNLKILKEKNEYCLNELEKMKQEIDNLRIEYQKTVNFFGEDIKKGDTFIFEIVFHFIKEFKKSIELCAIKQRMNEPKSARLKRPEKLLKRTNSGNFE